MCGFRGLASLNSSLSPAGTKACLWVCYTWCQFMGWLAHIFWLEPAGSRVLVWPPLYFPKQVPLLFPPLFSCSPLTPISSFVVGSFPFQWGVAVIHWLLLDSLSLFALLYLCLVLCTIPSLSNTQSFMPLEQDIRNGIK